MDGTQRLHGQLRDTAQRGQRDGYGGDQIEDAAWKGGRCGERGIEKLLKKKKGSKSRPGDEGPSPRPESPLEPSDGEPILPETLERPAPADGSKRMQIKTRDAVTARERGTVPSESGRSEPPSAVGSEQQRGKIQESAVRGAHGEIQPASHGETESPRIRTRGTDNTAVDTSPGHTRTVAPDSATRPSEQLTVKTKDAYTQRMAPEQRSQAMERGRQKFQKEQGEKAAAKRFGERRAVPESPSVSGDKPFVQHSSPWRQITRGGDVPAFTRGKAVHPSVSGPKGAIKAPEAGAKSVGRTASHGIKTAEHSAKRVLKHVDGGKAVGQAAKAAPLARRRAVQALRALKKPKAITATKAGTAALRATVRAARTLAAALAAGGSVVISAILVLCLVGVLAASPFGIFFADGGNFPDAVAPSSAVAQLNSELSDYLAAFQTGGTYDRIEILGQPPAWSDVFAVFAAKTAGATGGVDVVTLDTARVDLLRAVFWDMVKITSVEEPVEHPAVGNTPAWTENVLKITITPRTPDDMRVFYSFTNAQNQALDALLANGGLLTTLAGDLTISSQEAKALLAALPTDLDPERRAVMETACRLVGKVNYFWGGKSRVLGWDERWGQIRKVTASGSSTSGTYRPFGLDCSGFVDWVFYNVTGGSYIIGHGGGAHSQHGYCTAIAWDQAIPGDLVFYPGDTHVGIVGSRDESGNLLIIHCTYSKNNVVITDKSGFTSIARPNYYSE